MGLASDMKNLSDNLLVSFKQRINENEELVNDVLKTLEGFRNDHQEMARVLQANAADLRKELALGEKERLNNFEGLMTGIHTTVETIQEEVAAIQAYTLNMTKEFTSERAQMAEDMNKSFAHERAGRMKNEKNRHKEFDALMKEIDDDIKSLNNEVLSIFKYTNDMIDRFDKEHSDMSSELKANLGKNLAERVEYTGKLLNGFQKRLFEISKENQKMAQKLRKDLATGEHERLGEYTDIMKGIKGSIKDIQKEVKAIQKDTNATLTDLSQNREEAGETWNKMQATMAQIRKTGKSAAPKETARKAEKSEVKAEAAVKPAAKTQSKPEKKITDVVQNEILDKEEPKINEMRTLEEKVLGYITSHPAGVRISEMEEPLGETRMKLGFIAKNLMNEGKIQKIENSYFPKI